MTRQDFELIAHILSIQTGERHIIERIAHDFAIELKAANPRFDRARFLKACGVES